MLQAEPILTYKRWVSCDHHDIVLSGRMSVFNDFRNHPKCSNFDVSPLLRVQWQSMALSFGETLSMMPSSSSSGFWTKFMKMLIPAQTTTVTAAAARPKPTPRWVHIINQQLQILTLVIFYFFCKVYKERGKEPRGICLISYLVQSFQSVSSPDSVLCPSFHRQQKAEICCPPSNSDWHIHFAVKPIKFHISFCRRHNVSVIHLRVRNHVARNTENIA